MGWTPEGVFLGRRSARRLSLLLGLLLGLGCPPALGGTHTTLAAGPAPRSGTLLSVVPTSARAGATVTLIGVNYQPATSVATPTVAIAFTDAAGTAVTLPSTTTTTSGSFSIDSSVPITAAAGPGVFSATDSSGTAATATFDVRPSQTTVSSTPSNGLPGTS